MKPTGLVRKIDDLGRIVIPRELRKEMEMEVKDSVEVYVEEGNVVFKKYLPSCSFCNSKEDIITYKGKNVCSDCVRNLKQLK